MNGMLVAILAQSMLLFGSSAGFNQPSSSGVSGYPEKVSTEIVRKDISLKPGGFVLLDTEFGNVTVEEYDGSDIRVELKLRGTPEGISNFRFTHNYFGSQLTLKGWYENKAASVNGSLDQVEFVLMIPRGASYSVSASTRQGNINAAITGNLHGVELSTEAGSVRLKLPSNLAANIDLSTTELGKVLVNPGKIFSVICPNCEIRKDDRLKVRMNGGGASVTAFSAIGSVYLELTSRDTGDRS